MRLLVVVEGKDLREWNGQHAAGEAPGALPYGMERLADHGVQLSNVPAPNGARQRLAGFFEYRTGLPFLYPLKVARAAAEVDLVLTFWEDQALLLGELKRLGLLKARLVVVLCWLAERILNYPFARIERYARALGAADLLVCFSRNQSAIIANRLGIDGERVMAVPFGVDPIFFPAAPETEPTYVVAAGSDIGRDYWTLAEAARLFRTPIKLVAGPWNVRGLELPANVEFVGNLRVRDYQRVLAGAAVVAVPTHPFAYPSGQSVALDAMMSGKPVVVTDTPAIREYVTEEVGVRVPAGDPEALALALAGLTEDHDQRRRLGAQAAVHARQMFTTRQMWDTIAPALKAVV